MCEFLSVIIPFHNVESTIGRTLQSLANQDAREVRYILVNDGSSDESLDKVKHFLSINPKFNDNVKLISHTYRCGLSESFNTGLDASEGEYIIQCDADDYVDSNYYRLLIDAARTSNADIIWTPYTREINGRSRIVKPLKKIKSLNDIPIDTIHFSLCNKIIRRSLLISNGIKAYPRIDCWEDLGVFARIMALKPAINMLDCPGYHYVTDKSGSSLTQNRHELVLHDHLMCALLLEKWFIDHKIDSEYNDFLTNLKFFAKIKYLRGKNPNIEAWKATYPEVNRHIMTMRQLKWYFRPVFALIQILPTRFTQWLSDLLSKQ